MSNPSLPRLEEPSSENGWKWRVYGLGMVWDHAQEWQARWKLHLLQVSSGTTQNDGT